ncbi:hypothetical protein FACS1894126_5490 [Alphaproteobacteria bacterium]|nr:hypothetical protein FACS1894126_5490 [Alphaproteobacteria bacterium]
MKKFTVCTCLIVSMCCLSSLDAMEQATTTDKNQLEGSTAMSALTRLLNYEGKTLNEGVTAADTLNVQAAITKVVNLDKALETSSNDGLPDWTEQFFEAVEIIVAWGNTLRLKGYLFANALNNEAIKELNNHTQILMHSASYLPLNVPVQPGKEQDPRWTKSVADDARELQTLMDKWGLWDLSKKD